MQPPRQHVVPCHYAGTWTIAAGWIWGAMATVKTDCKQFRTLKQDKKRFSKSFLCFAIVCALIRLDRLLSLSHFWLLSWFRLLSSNPFLHIFFRSLLWSLWFLWLLFGLGFRGLKCGQGNRSCRWFEAMFIGQAMFIDLRHFVLKDPNLLNIKLKLRRRQLRLSTYHLILRPRCSFRSSFCTFPGCKLQFGEGCNDLAIRWASSAQLLFIFLLTWRWCHFNLQNFKAKTNWVIYIVLAD